MKWVVTTMNFSSVTRTWRTVRSMSRLFAVMAVAALLFLFATGLLGLAQHKWPGSSVTTMKGAAATLSTSFFLDMLAMEMPQLQGQTLGATFSPKNTFTFLVRSLTGIHPADPKSLLASELPGMRSESSALLYSGSATKETDYPADFTPPPDAIRPGGGQGGTNTPAQPQTGTTPGTPAAPAPDASSKEPQIFIYHSHNRESFLPELKSKGITSPDLAYDSDVNVTLVGKRLKDKIEALGIPTMQAATDYPTSVQSFNYAKSYAYSAATVKQALEQHKQIGMIFDVHRDALARDKTTARIGDKDYAQVYFVVGKKNPHWQQNSDFANKIHTLLEKKMPGLSRGVYGKASNGNAEYNQSLSPNSILLEIGGPYNTLEEMYRTADLLAETIAELQRDAVKANAQAGAAKPSGG
ncbi:stage II sporulation protein P [Paenibacillus flagellatus]|uniref:Stage II sporulation protein P n=1 Tax=Paenibacillus flagellatus TaxID=2211139 RepID=A0A2V5K268_9BACL|nr:stage II sporulation protein P [Paenibacillus flagellatus]PYI51854.1 stage II sporulation protein P [Paenibacillus flagellatus]